MSLSHNLKNDCIHILLRPPPDPAPQSTHNNPLYPDNLNRPCFRSQTSNQTAAQSPSRLPTATSAPPAPATAANSLSLSHIWPRALLLLVATIWGTNFPILKLIQSGLDPVPLSTAALTRFTLSTLALTPFALRELYRIPIPAQFLRDALQIGLLITAAYFSQSLALLETTANKAAFLCTLSVILVPVLSPLFPPASRARPSYLPPALALLGVACLELNGTAPVPADLLALLQAPFFAAGFLANARAAARYPAHLFTLTAVQLSVVALCAAVWAVFSASPAVHAPALPDLTPALRGANVVALMYTGVVSTAVSVWLENVALRFVTAAEMSVLLATEPFWAAGVSAIVLRERFGLQAEFGAVCILAACLVHQMRHFEGVDGASAD